MVVLHMATLAICRTFASEDAHELLWGLCRPTQAAPVQPLERPMTLEPALRPLNGCRSATRPCRSFSSHRRTPETRRTAITSVRPKTQRHVVWRSAEECRALWMLVFRRGSLGDGLDRPYRDVWRAVASRRM